jgi:hypothetical protein
VLLAADQLVDFTLAGRAACRGAVKPLSPARAVLCLFTLGAGCAHSGAGGPADEEAAVAEGILAAIRLYSPGKASTSGPYCIEVNASPGFERGVVELLTARGVEALTMPECKASSKDAVFWVKVQTYEWMDWMAHTQLDVRGTVETRPDVTAGYRLSWWRATFRASLGLRDGKWTTLAADDLGRI